MVAGPFQVSFEQIYFPARWCFSFRARI